MQDEREKSEELKKQKVSAELRAARLWSKIALVNAILSTALAFAYVPYAAWSCWTISKEKSLSRGKADVCCVSNTHVETENGVALAGRESSSNAIDHAVSFTVTGKTVAVSIAD